MKNAKTYFKLKSAKRITEMGQEFLDGKEVILNTSDLSVQNDDFFLQFDLVREEMNKNKVTLKTGYFNIEKSSAGLVFIPMELNTPNLSDTSKAYKDIEREFDNFFERLPVYDELGILKKRGVLLYGPPGTGKSTNIARSVKKLLEGGDAAVIVWNTGSIPSDAILDLFATGIEYHESVKKVTIIIEDIGMSIEEYGGAKEVDRSLLNLLDGASSTIQIPTFFVATTNYAHNLPEPLVRPGRFDAWIEVGLPSPQERVDLVEFLSKSELSEEDKKAILNKDLNEFSVAHLKELVLRTKRDGKSYTEVVKDLKSLKDRFKKGFDNKKEFGLL
jgi:hypothetical protein